MNAYEKLKAAEDYGRLLDAKIYEIWLWYIPKLGQTVYIKFNILTKAPIDLSIDVAEVVTDINSMWSNNPFNYYLVHQDFGPFESDSFIFKLMIEQNEAGADGESLDRLQLHLLLSSMYFDKYGNNDDEQRF